MLQFPDLEGWLNAIAKEHMSDPALRRRWPGTAWIRTYYERVARPAPFDAALFWARLLHDDYETRGRAR